MKKIYIKISRMLLMFVLIMSSNIFISTPTVVLAETVTDKKVQYTLLEPLPCIPGNGITCQEGKLQTTINFETYVQYAFNLIIAISAVAAVFMIVWGGFKYVTSDSFLGKDEGKKIIMQALQGLLLALCSYLILRTIDPRLVAIPSSIVDPLKIKCAPENITGRVKAGEEVLISDSRCKNMNLTEDSFYQLSSSELSKYKMNVDQYRADNAKLIEDIATLEKQKNSLSLELESIKRSGDTEGILALEGKLANVQDKINQTKGSVGLNVGIGVIDRFVYTSEPSTGTVGRDFGQAVTDMQVAYNKQYVSMRDAGAQPDQLKYLGEYLRYSEALIKMNESVAKVRDVIIEYESLGTPSKTVAPITGRKTDAIAKLTTQQNNSYLSLKKTFSDYRGIVHDQALLTQLNQKYLTAQKMINSMKIE